MSFAGIAQAAASVQRRSLAVQVRAAHVRACAQTAYSVPRAQLLEMETKAVDQVHALLRLSEERLIDAMREEKGVRAPSGAADDEDGLASASQADAPLSPAMREAITLYSLTLRKSLESGMPDLMYLVMENLCKRLPSDDVVSMIHESPQAVALYMRYETEFHETNMGLRLADVYVHVRMIEDAAWQSLRAMYHGVRACTRACVRVRA